MNEVAEQVEQALSIPEGETEVRRLFQQHQDDEEIASSIRQRINAAGYRAAFASHLEQARAILELNTQLFPNDANGWDSLAEVHLMMEDPENSLKCYRHALRLDPDFSNAADQIEKILEMAD